MKGKRADLPPMLSYAQNFEDVVLRRVFAATEVGFYVDVGASDPVEDSVTLHFYNRGWCGVNVEPDPHLHAALVSARPRDVNLHAAIGPGVGHATFFPTGTRGHGTTVADIAAVRVAAPAVTVPQLPLAHVLAMYAPATGVDFLKVDVEGSEAGVLASTDWRQVRPRVIVIEAVDADGVPTHQSWEPDLLHSGYVFGLFDGLNRFYCRQEDAETLLPRLAAPANVLDNFRIAREMRAFDVELDSLREGHERLAKEFSEERARHEATRAARLEAETAYREVQAALAAEAAAAADIRGTLAIEKMATAEARSALVAERAAHARSREELSAVYASTCWRITAPLRDGANFMRLLRRGRP